MTSLATRAASGLFSPTDGSRTIVIHDSQPREEASGSEGDGSEDRLVGTLLLRGGPRSRPAVTWNEDVVDNEGMGKKKSKSEYSDGHIDTKYVIIPLVSVCCIYHKPKRFDESSDEEDSSDSEDDKSDNDHNSHHHHHHHHHHHRGTQRPLDPDARNTTALRGDGGSGTMLEIRDDSTPNTYERPTPNKPKKGKEKAV